MVILEAKTFERFGYYSQDLSYGSAKKIVCACDECGKIREIRKDVYRSLCISCVQKGRIPWNKGKTGVYSKDTLEAMSKGRSGKVAWNKGKKHSERHKQNLRKARKHRKYPKYHTKPELIFEAICRKYDLPFHYTGNGELWIGKKGQKQLNPDFIEANGKKICVEIFGDYWHSPLLKLDMKASQTLNYRKMHYRKFRWTSIFIWERDLKRKDAEQFVLHELSKCR